MKAKNVAGYRNYDSSEFAAQSPLLDDDDAMEALWKKEYSLAELVASDQFKSYEDLKKRLGYVLGNKTVRQDPEVVEEDNDRGSAEELVTAATTPSRSTPGDEEDDALSYFQQLAES